MSSTISKIRLDSENICFFGTEPKFNDETRQVLTLHQSGQIDFKGYRYGDQTLLRKKKVLISPKVIQHLFHEIEIIALDSVRVTDVGTWEMDIYYPDYHEEFFGSLISGNGFDKVSDGLRKITKIHQLFAFNGNYDCSN